MLTRMINAAEWVLRLNHIVRKPNQHLANLLRHHSKELDDISMSFTKRTEGIEIVSFYEERAMKLFSDLVCHPPCSCNAVYGVLPKYQKLSSALKT